MVLCYLIASPSMPEIKEGIKGRKEEERERAGVRGV